MGIFGITGMAQSLRNGKVCIVKLHIFADQTDADVLGPGFDFLHHFRPFLQIRCFLLKAEFS